MGQVGEKIVISGIRRSIPDQEANVIIFLLPGQREYRDHQAAIRGTAKHNLKVLGFSVWIRYLLGQ